MSLPLSRRIARTALLLAAGAASAVGATGSANAAELLPTKDLGGLSNLDGANLGDAIDDTSRDISNQAGKTGGKAVRNIVPAAGETVGSTGKSVLPAAQKTAGSATGATGSLVGDTAKSAAKGKKGKKGKGKLPSTQQLTKSDSLPTDVLPSVDKLPLKDLPLG
ncbi:hypothetical protein [Streptomyces megasporus]|uniref:hypothetical protein n=1 Tax=Streptomyces megasporus TaxID=44060 RepID=UPI0004E20A77|nr:hypothetical protein [Streptomyces megasporus]